MRYFFLGQQERSPRGSSFRVRLGFSQERFTLPEEDLPLERGVDLGLEGQKEHPSSSWRRKGGGCRAYPYTQGMNARSASESLIRSPTNPYAQGTGSGEVFRLGPFHRLTPAQGTDGSPEAPSAIRNRLTPAPREQTGGKDPPISLPPD